MAKRIKVGDVVEVNTRRGLAYIQYLLRQRKYGALVKALPGFFDERPSNFSWVARTPAQFKTFLPLQACINQEIFEVVANEEVSDEDAELPLFKSDMSSLGGGWWIWDGEEAWKVAELSEEEKAYPIRGIWNDTLLIERLEDEWTHLTVFEQKSTLPDR